MTTTTENDHDDDDDDDAGQQPRVTDAPMEIWLQYGDDLLVDTPHSTLARDGDVSWCDSQVFPFDVKYVRADEIDRLRARVAELEAAKGEPGVWLRDQRGHYEGRETLDPMFYLGARNPGRGANGATYSPFYAAPPAPRVDVDAISDEALNAAWSYIIFNAENEQTEAVYDMRAALRAIFNKGE